MKVVAKVITLVVRCLRLLVMPDQTFRKSRGKSVWHFSNKCRYWPTEDYEEIIGLARSLVFAPSVLNCGIEKTLNCPVDEKLREPLWLSLPSGCHAEQSEASRILMLLRRQDSSPLAQNDIEAQAPVRTGDHPSKISL